MSDSNSRAQCGETMPALKSPAKLAGSSLLWWLDNPKKLRFFGEPLFWLAGRRGQANRPRIPANVAVVKLDRLGDVVLCSQFLASLRRAWPDSRITLFVR